jgi:hypothetical protein
VTEKIILYPLSLCNMSLSSEIIIGTNMVSSNNKKADMASLPDATKLDKRYKDSALMQVAKSFIGR